MDSNIPGWIPPMTPPRPGAGAGIDYDALAKPSAGYGHASSIAATVPFSSAR